ncbi:hypothetical protein ZWY2020_009550 [Hordeum vulgare]|nr:hypothetical protein ZWY2020_009550 [Hordeum vulgare]
MPHRQPPVPLHYITDTATVVLRHEPAVVGDVSPVNFERGGAPSQNLDDRCMLHCNAKMFHFSADVKVVVLHHSTSAATSCFTAVPPPRGDGPSQHQLSSHLHRSTRWASVKLHWSVNTDTAVLQRNAHDAPAAPLQQYPVGKRPGLLHGCGIRAAGVQKSNSSLSKMPNPEKKLFRMPSADAEIAALHKEWDDARGAVKGWEIIKDARQYLDEKPRSCSREACMRIFCGPLRRDEPRGSSIKGPEKAEASLSVGRELAYDDDDDDEDEDSLEEEVQRPRTRRRFVRSRSEEPWAGDHAAALGDMLLQSNA